MQCKLEEGQEWRGVLRPGSAAAVTSDRLEIMKGAEDENIGGVLAECRHEHNISLKQDGLRGNAACSRDL